MKKNHSSRHFYNLFDRLCGFQHNIDDQKRIGDYEKNDGYRRV